jgi:hypothetical protein
MEGTSGADVLDKQHNVIRMVSMTCSEGILLRLGLQKRRRYFADKGQHRYKADGYRGTCRMTNICYEQ